ncbi:hypothetical protein [Streptomyces sp. NBC_00009]|uniref:hypothetical protein n=1 Tax=Streptomyces sp. NBC_00009 TaxID=2975620 RepID=UPI003248C29D
MSPHEQCPFQDCRVVIDPAFKTDAPARYARLRESGPLLQTEFHLGLKGWVIVGHDLAWEALTHPDLLKDATPAADALAAAGYVLHKTSVGLGAQMTEADPPEHTRLRRLASAAFTLARVPELELATPADSRPAATGRRGMSDLMDPRAHVCDGLAHVFLRQGPGTQGRNA